MKFLTWPAIAGLLAALLILDRWVLPVTPGGNPRQEPISYAQAVHTATPSVVNIYTAKLVNPRRSSLLENRYFRRFSPPESQRQRIERSLGSGVIMTRQGHILTNNHVISGADAIQVLLQDGRSASAVVVGTDSATDLAVLRIDLPDLQPIEQGNSNTARVGDVVLAIGNPLGFGHSVTQGIVSAFAKAMLAVGEGPPSGGTALISVRDADKPAAVRVAGELAALGFSLAATAGTAAVLERAGLAVRRVNKVLEGRPHIVDMIKNDEADLIINTTEGRRAIEDSASIRASAESHRVFYTTTMAAAEAVCMALRQEGDQTVRRLQDLHRSIVA